MTSPQTNPPTGPTPEPPRSQSRLIKHFEETYAARYVGEYDLPDREGPFDVFWQETPPQPDYDNYFAVFQRPSDPDDLDGRWATYITSARSIREATFSAYEYAPGQFICSRHRHNFVTAPDGKFLDGGLAYVRGNVLPTHRMRVVDGVEVFEAIERALQSPTLPPPPVVQPQTLFNVRVRHSPDPDGLDTWDVQIEKLRGWKTLAYHIEDRDDAIVIGRALAQKYDRELLIDEDEHQ